MPRLPTILLLLDVGDPVRGLTVLPDPDVEVISGSQFAREAPREDHDSSGPGRPAEDGSGNPDGGRGKPEKQRTYSEFPPLGALKCPGQHVISSSGRVVSIRDL